MAYLKTNDCVSERRGSAASVSDDGSRAKAAAPAFFMF